MEKMYFMCNMLILVVVAVAGEELSCITCDSATNIQCARQPENVFNRNCTEPHSKCFTRTHEGRTIRGCVVDTEEELAKINCDGSDNEDGEKTCEVCQNQFDGCNSDIFPSHRIECLQCQSKWDDPTGCYSDTNQKGLPCPLYVSGDKCYIWKSEKDQVFKRGCLSDAATKECKNNEHCYICHGPSCNFLLGNNEEIPIYKGSSDVIKVSFVSFVLAFLLISFN